jgi:hypothetical protein
MGHFVKKGDQKSRRFQIPVYCNAMNTMKIAVVSVHAFPRFGHGKLNFVPVPEFIAIQNAAFRKILFKKMFVL